MKQLTFKLILPLSILSFACITKWWYTLPVDAPDTMFIGFPLPYVCDGWHTSMSLQIFLTELLFDFLIYFLFWFLLVYGLNRLLTKISMHKMVTIVLWTLAGLVLFGATLIASNSDNLFYLNRKFEFELMETGYKFVWQHTEWPDYYQYHPEKRNQSNIQNQK